MLVIEAGKLVLSLSGMVLLFALAMMIIEAVVKAAI